MEGVQQNHQRERSGGLDRERSALLGLWAVPGIGPKTLDTISHELAPPAELLDVPCRDWAGKLFLSVSVRRRLDQVETLREISSRVRDRAERKGIRIAYAGDPDYPENLVGCPDAPPLLFMMGERVSGPRRRVAMVGSRHADTGFDRIAQGLATALARAGLGIVSGAAEGVDTYCHDGALEGGGENWAFLGSALDVLDPHQAKLAWRLLGKGGVFYSELPPGVRAKPEHFPRRNRLISGASDAVLVLRAKEKAGSLHTATSALAQGRPILALPGEIDNPVATGTNQLIRSGNARICLGIEDVLVAVGLSPQPVGEQPAEAPELDEPLSEPARVVLGVLERAPRSFEEVKGACGLASGAVTSALCELELLNLVIQKPGKVYEKI